MCRAVNDQTFALPINFLFHRRAFLFSIPFVQFASTVSFNQDIGAWNVSQVVSMAFMVSFALDVTSRYHLTVLPICFSCGIICVVAIPNT